MTFPASVRLTIFSLLHLVSFPDDGEQGWRSGESTRLPPMWPGFDSRSRCHMWVEFVGGSRPSSEGLSPDSPGSPKKIPSRISGRRATLWRCHCKFQFISLLVKARLGSIKSTSGLRLPKSTKESKVQ